MTGPYLPWPEVAAVIRQILVDIEFARIAEEESKRTLVVPPADLGRAQWIVEQNGAERIITVKAHAWLPSGSWYLLDVNAMEASFQEMLAEIRRTPIVMPPWEPPAHWAGHRRWPRIDGLDVLDPKKLFPYGGA
jgi:hypothetical protein